jgi:hypothetical protein
MTTWLQPLDGATCYRYARFAAATGARFNAGTGDVLDGINDTVEKTTVEAVVDSQGRPYTLWLRTPEPVDWRRVSATLRIRHVKQSDDCPTEYEKRNPLDLAIEILPSPDASAAFLVGSLAGHRTRLPRGDYELTLTFDTKLAQLPHLRPTLAVGSTPEQVTMKFIQPSGQRWPLPITGIVIPAGLLEKLVKIYDIDWSIVDLLSDPKFDPKRLKELIRVIPPRPRPPEPTGMLTDVYDFAALVEQLESAHERLTSPSAGALAELSEERGADIVGKIGEESEARDTNNSEQPPTTNKDPDKGGSV